MTCTNPAGPVPVTGPAFLIPRVLSMRPLLLLLCGTLLLSGCGTETSGPDRFHVSGKVTFNGQPVKAGTIYFQPTTGPAGSAQIVDGAYDTKSGQGVVGGPHQVQISGFDGNAVNPGEMGNPVFNPHTIEKDLPKEDTVLDIEVPASAAEGLIISNDPA